jgi:hypothetical protein
MLTTFIRLLCTSIRILLETVNILIGCQASAQTYLLLFCFVLSFFCKCSIPMYFCIYIFLVGFN